uniref:Caprin-1 dimerization domain-containing protein n=1 Tax=Timema monikensis TaxID=170555 RepID=A0A7R9EJL9_9NEOP|nr:unnamed protein product [Timema monikensis]
MPSASTAKLEKQASTEAVDPLRQAIVVIDHKIRNLVKRKRKIEQYEAEQKSGKNLNSDQLLAVSKKDEVMQTLEFARDLSKSFNTLALDTAKTQKKQARKEALERNQQDIAKVKEILLVQDILANMGQDNVREDFLAGQNGAVQLTEEELKYLDDLYGEVSPKRIAEEGSPPFQDQLQHSAEHLVAIVDGKTKEIVGTTYLKLKEIVASIQSCGYFDQTTEEAAEGNSEQLEAVEVEQVQEPAVEEEIYVEKEPTVVAQETATFLQAIPTVPLEVQPVVSMLVQQQQAVPISTPVATSEGSYFSTAAATFVPGQMQQTQRSIPEFISSVTDGSIHFLQDSELDPPDISVMLTGSVTQQRVGPTPPPAPIPSQTFTNQSFASVSTASGPQQVLILKSPQFVNLIAS